MSESRLDGGSSSVTRMIELRPERQKCYAWRELIREVASQSRRVVRKRSGSTELSSELDLYNLTETVVHRISRPREGESNYR